MYNKEDIKLSVHKAGNTNAFNTSEMMHILTRSRKYELKLQCNAVVHILGWQIRLNIHSATEPECIYNRSHSWLMEFKLLSLPSVERETHRLS